ncbi:hypothetical protein BKG59_14370 [Mycobacteroides chelonae]|uniref:Uncharacterized protein n=1 Tax=Mycobacteroides chelonae TaxID=1774 RepID=A0AB73MA04_MYCCH|nr:hypothetical protein BKG62_13175 [Mycobacteroides chelonae]OHT52961.1 hypothetical protein BKG63_13400 [Mycobacteroides chelonae]OHT60913.1 hypothetical protein BKG65_21150 [Mycobacteroides chelonae]OHT63454.1 hypothetical protein BKG64_06240 [Mycobacteroides chelonae]OHT74779.1 hypothetical protein BKG66_00695 [Mycobacteroides chelonae]
MGSEVGAGCTGSCVDSMVVVSVVVDDDSGEGSVVVVLGVGDVVVSGVLSLTTRLSVDNTMVMSTATIAMMAAMVPTIAGPVRYQGVGFSLSSIIPEK